MQQAKLYVCKTVEKPADIVFMKKPGVNSFTCGTCGQ